GSPVLVVVLGVPRGAGGGRGMRGTRAADATPAETPEAGLPLVPARHVRHLRPSPHERTSWHGRALLPPYGSPVTRRGAGCRKLSDVTLRVSAAVPPRASHVEAREVTLGGPARLLQRRALRAVAGQGPQLVPRQQDAVRADDPPPGDGAAVQGHRTSHLARTALPQPLGHVPVRHDPSRRDELGHFEDAFHV